MEFQTIEQIFQLDEVPLVEFNEKWDYHMNFGRATEHPLKPGERVKAICPKTNQKLLMVGSKYGTFVAFQRYPHLNPNTWGMTFPVGLSASSTLSYHYEYELYPAISPMAANTFFGKKNLFQ